MNLPAVVVWIIFPIVYLAGYYTIDRLEYSNVLKKDAPLLV